MAKALRGEVRATRPALSRDDVDVLTYWLGESDGLQELRRKALDRYRQTPLPKRWRHLWKYTAPESLFPRGGILPQARDGSGLPTQPPYDGAVVVVGPGTTPRVTMGAGARAKGLRILPLSEAGTALRDLRGYGELGGLVGPEHGLFEALNGAGWSTGVVVHVPQGRRITEPVVIRTEAVSDQASVPRLLVLAEPRAEVTVFEDHLGGGEDGSVIAVTEVFADQAARVSHALVQRWARGTTGHVTVRGSVSRDASLESVVVSLGGDRAKLDLGALLVEPGASSEIRGVVLGSEGQHMDHHTVHDHRAPHTHSNIDLKVVLGDGARSSYTGLIRIAEDAGGSEAYQENRNVLLGDDARADTIPELEILTDDVSCTHGATVAPTDPEQLFYLQSRGLSHQRALEVVLEGFFAKTVERLPESLREEVRERLARRLADVVREQD